MIRENFDKKLCRDNVSENSTMNSPCSSIIFLANYSLSKDAKIIDIGGADSQFVDHLLELGFRDITILDLSSDAIEKAKKRLGHQAAKVKWIVADVLSFQPQEYYDFWHDRDTFLFFTERTDVELYSEIASASVSKNGIMVVGAFSTVQDCVVSYKPVQTYTEHNLPKVFEAHFYKLDCIVADHMTASGVTQNFVFCSFSRN